MAGKTFGADATALKGSNLRVDAAAQARRPGADTDGRGASSGARDLRARAMLRSAWRPGSGDSGIMPVHPDACSGCDLVGWRPPCHQHPIGEVYNRSISQLHYPLLQEQSVASCRHVMSPLAHTCSSRNEQSSAASSLHSGKGAGCRHLSICPVHLLHSN